MLSHMILKRQEIGRAAIYYEDSADDYYAKDGEASEWQGRGADALGLKGTVDSQRLRELLAGEVTPGVSSRSATRQDTKERIGIDFTFSAPKSVSIQALVAGDRDIVKAHDRAVRKAMEAAEERAQARKKVNGKSHIETTGNLIIAKFRHETSRERDPQLHTHAVVMNLTQREDKAWRALKNDEMIKMTKYLGAVYRAELAAELQELGYQLRHERDGMFELAHISRDQLEGFSQRSSQIEQRLAEQGLRRETATTEQKQQAAIRSRAHKASIEREAVMRDWRERAKALSINFEKRAWEGAGSKQSGQEPTITEVVAAEAAKRAVRFAINHLTERETVIEERMLLATAMKQGIGAVKLTDIEKEIERQVQKGHLIREDERYKPAEEVDADNAKTKQEWVQQLVESGAGKNAAERRVQEAVKRGSLVQVDPRYTTKTALEHEKHILQIEREGRNTLVPILSSSSAREHLASSSLNRGQREAAELITTTTHRVVGIQGFAGTGKSHMLKTAKVLVEKEGYHVRALAPYGSQVKALRELGVKAHTVASFLRAKDKAIDSRTVLVIDEAGVLPTRLMKRTLQLAEQSGARVVLIGDVAQTKAIEAGRPFDQLQHAGMATAHMNQIQRQKNKALKEAVELAAKGHTKLSLERINAIVEIKEDETRRSVIANDYMKLSAIERDQTIIVSGTNEARRDINRQVRESLGVAGKGVEFDTLIRRDTTIAERMFSKYYRVGDVIQPERDYAKTGLKRGELYKVKDTGPGNRLTVRAESGEQIAFNPITHRKLSVYQPERTELSIGDMVCITRNDAKLDIANGDRFKVEAVQPDQLVLTDGKRKVELPTDTPLHLDHAYATTVHSSQGLTVDRVLIDTSTRSITTSKDAYYVAISRARVEARIYTDNVKELPKAIARESVKFAAFDIVKGRRISEYQKA